MSDKRRNRLRLVGAEEEPSITDGDPPEVVGRFTEDHWGTLSLLLDSMTTASTHTEYKDLRRQFESAWRRVPM